MSTEYSQAKSFTSASITRVAASALLDAAFEAASTMEAEITVAIVDAAGHLKAFGRADHATLLTLEVAIDKAWTAASFGIPTHLWTSLLATNPNLAPLVHRPRLMAVAGGYPILEGEQVIGGIGISGGRHLQDRQIAEAALKSVGFTLPEGFALSE